MIDELWLPERLTDADFVGRVNTVEGEAEFPSQCMLNVMSQDRSPEANVSPEDVLSSLLSTIRISGSMQFSIMIAGEWQADAAPFIESLVRNTGAAMPFHVVAEGCCWLRIDGEQRQVDAGDILAFPFASLHQLGNGSGASMIDPVNDLPERPWRQIPVLRYGNDRPDTRILCGFLQCDVLEFAPLKQCLPKLIHIKTGKNDAGWLRATVQQMAQEIDNPRVGGVSMLPRLTEIMFIEILRDQIAAAEPRTEGWLAALSDASLSRCLALIHADPQRDWSLDDLAMASQTSRTALAERFQSMLATSPVKYVRDWRLHLASIALAATQRPITAIAYEAGYGTEAAFTRAFKRAFSQPPATWRRMKNADGNTLEPPVAAARRVHAIE